MAEMFDQINIPLHQHELGKCRFMWAAPFRSSAVLCCTTRCRTGSRRCASMPGLALTTSRDILEALAEGKGPEHFLVTLGYSGWEQGQLEHEINENTWLTVPANEHILFGLLCGREARGGRQHALTKKKNKNTKTKKKKKKKKKKRIAVEAVVRAWLAGLDAAQIVILSRRRVGRPRRRGRHARSRSGAGAAGGADCCEVIPVDQPARVVAGRRRRGGGRRRTDARR